MGTHAFAWVSRGDSGVDMMRTNPFSDQAIRKPDRHNMYSAVTLMLEIVNRGRRKVSIVE